jgi:hypothetical protein
MPSLIKMGNDEFILYIRKNSTNCNIPNNRLGRLIWVWLRKNGATKIAENQKCYWGKHAGNIGNFNLPKTSAQFEFNRSVLPELFTYLGSFI